MHMLRPIVRRLRAPLAALVFVLLALPAGAQTYCECFQGSGPCGNDQPTALPSGCQNSTGSKGFLGPNSGFSVAADELVLSSINLPAGNPALLVMGGSAARTPFGDGVLCVANTGAGLHRYAVGVTMFDGSLVHGPGLGAYAMANFPANGWHAPGDTWMFQLWYRDPGGPCGSGFNLTNGVAITLEP